MLQHNKMNINNCLFAIAKLYSGIVLRKLNNENSAIFRIGERNYKTLVNLTIIECPKSFVMRSLLVACSNVLYIDYYNSIFVS